MPARQAEFWQSEWQLHMQLGSPVLVHQCESARNKLQPMHRSMLRALPALLLPCYFKGLLLALPASVTRGCRGPKFQAGCCCSLRLACIVHVYCWKGCLRPAAGLGATRLKQRLSAFLPLALTCRLQPPLLLLHMPRVRVSMHVSTPQQQSSLTVCMATCISVAGNAHGQTPLQRLPACPRAEAWAWA